MKFLSRRVGFYSSLIILLLSLSASTLVYSQRSQSLRPKLQKMRRDYFAGKFLLVPDDYREMSVQQPSMVAQIADHELIIPPERLLDNSEKLNSWLQRLDFDEVDGAIISLDTIAGSPGSSRCRNASA